MSKKRSKADMGCANCPYRISAITSYNACNPVFSLMQLSQLDTALILKKRRNFAARIQPNIVNVFIVFMGNVDNWK
jgi:hypothetical protein